MAQAGGVVFTANALKKRFPIFCSRLKFTNEDVDVVVEKFKGKKTRGDRWCVRLMEGIFDAAALECDKVERDDELATRGMTSFANFAFGYLQNLFSVLELRKQIVIELLIAVIIAAEKEQRIEDDVGEIIIASNFRATIFIKLLSEEWGSDTLMIFLHCRSIFQAYCRISFVEVSSAYFGGINNELYFNSSNSAVIQFDDTDGVACRKAPRKTIMKSLPTLGVRPGQRSLYFLTDVAFKSAPVVAFDISILPIMCRLFLPNASIDIRNYMVKRMLNLSSEEVLKAIHSSFYSTHEDAGVYVGQMGYKSNGVVVVSGYMVFYFLCLEFQQICQSSNNYRMEIVVNVMENLHDLNEIYADDCARVRKIDQIISDLNLDLAKCENEMTKVSKSRRRLERKFTEGVINKNEMADLMNVRVLEIQKSSELKAIQSKIEGLFSREEIVTEDITRLWSCIIPKKKKKITEDKMNTSKDHIKALSYGPFSEIFEAFSNSWRHRVNECLERAFEVVNGDMDHLEPKTMDNYELEKYNGLGLQVSEQSPHEGFDLHSKELKVGFPNPIDVQMKDEWSQKLVENCFITARDKQKVDIVDNENCLSLKDKNAQMHLNSKFLPVITQIFNIYISRMHAEMDRLKDSVNTVITIRLVEDVVNSAMSKEKRKVKIKSRKEGVTISIYPRYYISELNFFPFLHQGERGDVLVSLPEHISLTIGETMKRVHTHYTGCLYLHKIKQPDSNILNYLSISFDNCQNKIDANTKDLCVHVLDTFTTREVEGMVVNVASISYLYSNVICGRKQDVIDDIWKNLDLDPHLWLFQNTLIEVEKKYISRVQRRWSMLKSSTFRCLVNESKVLKFLKCRNNNTLSLIILIFRENILYNRRLQMKEIAAEKIQRNHKVCSNYRNFQKYLNIIYQNNETATSYYEKRLRIESVKFYWALRMRIDLRRKFVIVLNLVHDRILALKFYTWKYLYYGCRRRRFEVDLRREFSVKRIQCMFRCWVNRNESKFLLSQLRLVMFFRLSLSKKLFETRKTKCRHLSEISKTIQSSNCLSQINRKYMKWWGVRRVKEGLTKIAALIWRKLIQKRYLKLKEAAAEYHLKYYESIIIIQCTFRMLRVKLSVLSFYRWRKGLILLQAIVRKRIQLAVFLWILRDFRAAQVIQKIIRGHLMRSRFFDLRLLAIHYSASDNSYEKLLHLVNKYPEMIHELDKDGNTALHNAAKKASRRTLKLLLKKGLDPNVINLMGYSPLHLIIMSKATNRDDCCLYMLNRGFDSEIRTPDGKSCLLLACEHGRSTIVSHLIANGEDPNVFDNSGLTCLQAACAKGSAQIVQNLLIHGADPNVPGARGFFPMHDAINSGNIDIVKEMVSYGADVNKAELYNHQSPLMWACQTGNIEMVHFLLLQGANVKVRDLNNWTALHYSVFSDDMHIIQSLLEADVDFNSANSDGNTALHIAVQNYSVSYLRSLLEMCAKPSIQNLEGNQPIHIASRNNDVESLKLLCLYDEYIGRVNYSYETPYGIAGVHNATDALLYFNSHFDYANKASAVSGENSSRWNSEIERKGNDGAMVIPDSAEDLLKFTQICVKPVLRKVEMVTEANTITMHSYKMDHLAVSNDVEYLMLLKNAATVLTKCARRKLAYAEIKHERNKKRVMHIMNIFFVKYKDGFLKRMYRRNLKGIIKFQSIVRGKKVRAVYFGPYGRHYEQYIHRTKRRLSSLLWALYLKYKRRFNRVSDKLTSVGSPRWENFASKVKRPKRVIGIYEEYSHPYEKGIYFYKNKLTGIFSYPIPLEIDNKDGVDYYNVIERQTHGFTKREVWLALKLQAIWRGYTTRSQHRIIATANKVSLLAESNYLQEPDVDHHLWNYALHCFVVCHDIGRARELYVEALRRMGRNGPDQALVLYSYAIFGFVTHDLDYVDVLVLLERARKAEEVREINLRISRGEAEAQAILKGTFVHGKIFRVSDVGFFKYQSMRHHNSLAAHNFAASRFLVFDDFIGSFDAFLEGFKWNAKDMKMKSNFDIMMRHFHGSDKNVLSKIVIERMRVHAERDTSFRLLREQRLELLQQKIMAAKVIQKCWMCRVECKGI